MDTDHHPAAEAEDAIIENDPLWLAVLKLMNNGGCTKALEMLEDPDQFRHAKIEAILLAQSSEKAEADNHPPQPSSSAEGGAAVDLVNNFLHGINESHCT